MSAKRSNQKVIQQKYPMLYLIPLIAVLAVIPALLYECDVNTGLTKYNWYTGSQTTIDFFLYVKAIWLYVTFGVMLFLTFYMVYGAPGLWWSLPCGSLLVGGPGKIISGDL